MSLVERHTSAAAKTVERLELGELRLLVTQYTAGGLSDAVLRRVLDVLAENPLTAADGFPGDLLKAVLSLPSEYWASHQSEWLETHGILEGVDNALKTVEPARFEFTAMK